MTTSAAADKLKTALCAVEVAGVGVVQRALVALVHVIATTLLVVVFEHAVHLPSVVPV
jgi:hypothetical protein